MRLNYFIRNPNVGDLVNPTIVEGLSKIPTKRVERDAGAHLLAIGSIISAATADSRIWGTGLMHPKYAFGRLRAENVWAVRGEKTLSELRRHYPGIRDVPLGDPGILLPEILKVPLQPHADYRIGIVSHYVDRQDARVLSLLAEDGVVDLNVHQDPLAFIEQMAKCPVVASSSLHGLIFAEALGLPNLWIKISDKVAGEGFKFHDWYTTTARPQTRPHELKPTDCAEDLIARCEIRETKIDKEALRGALSLDRLETIREMKAKKIFSVAACRNKPTPCFLISFNRGNLLRRSISSLEKQDRNLEIIVHDNGSTEPTTLEILKQLEIENIIVYRRSPIKSPDDLNQVNDSVQRYFDDWAEPQRYLVSDCDIDVTEARSDAIDVFHEALNRLTELESVGPMLRISDIPESYPLKNHALNLHISQFWREIPQWFTYNNERLAFLKCRIDTTLALHRAGEPFKRLKKSARFYAPHEAIHLDWYISRSLIEANNADDELEVSHWGNENWLRKHGEEALKYPGYFDVSLSDLSRAEIVWKPIAGAPLKAQHRLIFNRIRLFLSRTIPFAE